ncbi:MAG: CDP-alcohol phosphatidyltransferase [Prevotellaceae bacterium]|nr:CDP-alcohol phosphatidyltransferase [Prevotellaceae bacterium]
MSNNQDKKEALARITANRHRTNLFRKHEQQLIAFLVRYVPSFITSDMLTLLGLAGSVITAGSFVLGKDFDRSWLLLGIAGLAINWVGDSLDGRLAYYRKTPRKWYGFSLDFCVDWLTNILIGAAYIYYAPDPKEFIGFAFVCLYGWAMMMALLRYKIAGTYTIDSGPFGPTEVRIIIMLILIAEVIFPQSIIYSSGTVCLALLAIDIKEFRQLLRIADKCDKAESEQSAASDN